MRPTLLPGRWLCCRVVAMVLLWFWSVVAMRLLCHVWFCLAAFGVAEQAFFDLYMTSAPVGHVPRQPLVTGPHLHPSPASSPPSSPSTLPSSSQSSVTGPPRFFPSYPFHVIFFFLVKRKVLSPVCSGCLCVLFNYCVFVPINSIRIKTDVSLAKPSRVITLQLISPSL